MKISTMSIQSKNKELPQQAKREGFLVVGLGASAGGLRSLIEFFTNTPPDSQMAFVVILHLSPDHKSQAAEILQNSTSMPVKQVNERMKVQPRHVYVIPPDKDLFLENGDITLREPERPFGQNLAVDHFFRALAETHKTNAACIVLSGTGADGSIGLKRVKEAGGIAIAQDPGEAEYDSMPRNAINTGMVDFILPVAGMPDRLIKIWRNGRQINMPEEEAAQAPDKSPAAEESIREILTMLRARTGHDFRHYKRATILRRLERRMQVNTLVDLSHYRDFLLENAPETKLLLNDLLINVTNFFRDRAAWEALESVVIPAIFNGKQESDQVRVWSAGCATGEEAYSITMLLLEYAATLEYPPLIQVFATDIDEQAIAVAREGSYSQAIEADVNPQRLRAFFTLEPGGYRVNKIVRDRVVFAVHNLIKDPPFSQQDLVICRNLLIYINRNVQEQIFDHFHFALRPKATLFLGNSELIEESSESFETLDKKHHFFQSRLTQSARRLIPSLSLESLEVDRRRTSTQVAQEPRVISPGELHQKFLERYASPSVIIDEEYNILHLSDHVGRYFLHGGGELSHNLLKVILPELQSELRTTLFQALQSGRSMETKQVRLNRGGQERYLNITAHPVIDELIGARFLLVMFTEVEEILGTTGREKPSSETGQLAISLEAENRGLKEQMRVSAEQYDAAIEELKAANEELQAAVEELRSMSEEHETGKEELQSLNEELKTVNEELNHKIDEVGATNDDLKNLISSTDIATIFLDNSLRIKRYTPRTLELFNLTPSDEGRELADFTHRLEYADLVVDAKKVLDSLQHVEREVRSFTGNVYLARMLPYRTTNNRIEGVILNFLDITKRIQYEEELHRIADFDAFRFTLSESLRPLSKPLEIQATAMSIIGERLQANRVLYAEIDSDDGTALIADNYVNGASKLIGRIQLSGFARSSEKLRAGKTLILTDVATDLDLAEEDRASFNALGIASCISAPIIREDRWVAIVGVHQKTPRAWTRYDVILLEETAERIWLELERAHAEERLRESEERLRLVVESVTDYAIFTTDPQGMIKSWNSGAERLFGYSEDEVIGRHMEIIFTPEDRERGAAEGEMRQACEAGRAEDERWHMNKDGERFYVSGVIAPLRDGNGELTGYAKIARNLTERKKLEDALQRAYDELEEKVRNRTLELAEANNLLKGEVNDRRAAEEGVKNLLKKLVTIQEEERRRIARDVHDQMGQQMTALRLKLESVKNSAEERSHLAEQVRGAQELAQELDHSIDYLTLELRPYSLDQFGLSLALADLVREWSARFNMPANYQARNTDNLRLAPDVESNLYRLTQEALHNIYKHAGASRVGVQFERHDDRLLLVIEDDGKGFDPERVSEESVASGLGLISMRERAALVGGELEIESSEHSGTTIFVRFPIRSVENRRQADQKGEP